MNLLPDQPPASTPEKTKLSAEERRTRQTDRLIMVRLRMTISQELADLGIIKPAAIAVDLGIPAPEATKLLTRRQWREGDVALLEAAAERLGLQTPGRWSRRS